MIENQISYRIRGAIFRVYNNLGPGLLESVYEMALSRELEEDGLSVKRQQSLAVVYMGEKQDLGFRMDLVVENKVVIEIKSVEKLHEVHHKQLLTYLRLANFKLGILVNFSTSTITDQIFRMVNNL
jgi:GxxExxY protein